MARVVTISSPFPRKSLEEHCGSELSDVGVRRYALAKWSMFNQFRLLPPCCHELGFRYL